MKTVHAYITGRVQGVGFRAWAAKEAAKLDLNGWVRNLDDGRVEALFHGEEAQLDEMLKRCARGPLAARVEKVETEQAENYAGPAGFRFLNA